MGTLLPVTHKHLGSTASLGQYRAALAERLANWQHPANFGYAEKTAFPS
jgi:hypothetical protein